MSSNRLPTKRSRKTRLAIPATWAVTFFSLLLLALPLFRGEAPVRWGLDLSGGVRVVYRPDPSSVESRNADLEPQALLGLAKDTLASRLARSLGTVPDVTVRSDGRIVVAVPGERDQQRVLGLVGETYRLTFRLVEDARLSGTPNHDTIDFEGRKLVLAPSVFSGEMLDERHLRVVTPQPSGMDLRSLSAEVGFRFRPPHDQSFEDFTRANVGRDLAILIDDAIEWVGRIESAIPGEGTLAGGYSVEDAGRIADMLRAGTLPVRLVVEDLESVGPSLGQSVRDLGWRALVFGIVSVLALLAIAYRHRRWLMIAGFESLICLLATTAGLIAVLGLTVDLAAIAGLVLSVGMGLDAFILVFESLGSGRPGAETSEAVRPQSWSRRIRRAYSFAREGGTLLHANATSLAVVALLASNERLGSFAVFIAVGILGSLITILATRRRLLGWRGIEPAPRHDLLARLRSARPRLYRFRFLYAGLLALVGVVLLSGLAVGGGPQLRLGADFAPGTQIVFSSPDAGTARATLDALDQRFPEASSAHQIMGRAGGDGDRHLVTLGTTLTLAPTGGAPDPRSAASVNQLIQGSGSQPGSLHAIDARVAGRRLSEGLSVLGLGFVSLGFYLVVMQPMIDAFLGIPAMVGSSRARWLIFLGIVLAVVLDVGLALAALAFFEIAIDLPVIAALLAIIGYSVNDSVVLANYVSRRVSRHASPGDSASARQSIEDPVGIVTRSIDRILSRTVLTSVSTMMPALGILAVGLEPLRAFALVIVVGTAAGTLSSMFVVGSFAVRALSAARRDEQVVVSEPVEGRA